LVFRLFPELVEAERVLRVPLVLLVQPATPATPEIRGALEMLAPVAVVGLVVAAEAPVA
jgi:hypothetical protein